MVSGAFFWLVVSLTPGVVGDTAAISNSSQSLTDDDFRGGFRDWTSNGPQLHDRKTADAKPVLFFGITPDTCQHAWTKTYGEDCPYGVAGWGDVTWPDYDKAKKLGVPIDQSLMVDSKFFQSLCVMYSYAFFAVALVAVIKVFVHRGTQELHYVIFLALVLGCQELLVKPFVQQPRPEMSCILTCGMPSSHAALSIGTLTLYLINGALRSTTRYPSCSLFVPRYLKKFEELDDAHQAHQRDQQMHFSRWWHVFCVLTLHHGPLAVFHSRFDEPCPRQLVFELIAWLVFILPVPLSRVQLGDHTELQVYCGMAVGINVALLWAYITWRLQLRFNPWIGSRWSVFHHNMALPCGLALKLLNTQDLPRDVAMGMLQWYEKETLYRLWKLRDADALTHAEGQFLRLRWCLLYELACEMSEAPFIGGTLSMARCHGHMDRHDCSKVYEIRSDYIRLAQEGKAQGSEPVLAWWLGGKQLRQGGCRRASPVQQQPSNPPDLEPGARTASSGSSAQASNAVEMTESFHQSLSRSRSSR
eukprot:TRINITY_DN8634_c0_g2_i1.p1 TRINITY_DN8634_c0_g2~~TRINITY_DN8634_c0_g2_i1.p1  ORF type:complete len:530 (-),score=86.80 TRINITY_DN8634_c0_g2_i1:91-1680(-)